MTPDVIRNFFQNLVDTKLKAAGVISTYRLVTDWELNTDPNVNYPLLLQIGDPVYITQNGNNALQKARITFQYLDRQTLKFDGDDKLREIAQGRLKSRLLLYINRLIRQLQQSLPKLPIAQRPFTIPSDAITFVPIDHKTTDVVHGWAFDLVVEGRLGNTWCDFNNEIINIDDALSKCLA